MKSDERIFAPVYEISSENMIAGRRPIKVVLHEIFPNDTRWQDNGISWKEEYVQANLHSVVGMSIVAAFLTEDRDVPYDHGMTEVREEDKLPLFEDATMVGHFEKAYIDDVEIEGVVRRVLIAEGTLDEMRYPRFVAWLRDHMAESAVKGSVEIVGKPEHDGYIIYDGGWKDEGRVPQYYDYSGYAILGVKPADEAAVVMELNQKCKEEDETMDEKTKKELLSAVTSAVSEANSRWDEYWAKISEKEAEIAKLNVDIAEKEAEIAKIQADFDAAEAARADAIAKLDEATAQAEADAAKLTEANAKIAKLEGEAAMAELNAALAPYTEKQRAVAQEDIDAFTADPGSIEINSIVGKICTAMVQAARDNHVAESNSANQIDVFGMTDDVTGHKDSDTDDIDVF